MQVFDRIHVCDIPRGNTVGEVELAWAQLRTWNISLVDLVEGDTQARVVLRRTAVVEVLGPTGDGNRGQRKKASNSLHLGE